MKKIQCIAVIAGLFGLSASASAASLALTAGGTTLATGTITHATTYNDKNKSWRLELRGYGNNREFFCTVYSKSLADLSVIEQAAGTYSSAQITCNDNGTASTANRIVVPMDGSPDPTRGSLPTITIVKTSF